MLLLGFVVWYAFSKSIKALNVTTEKLRDLSQATNESSKEVESISEEVSSSANQQASGSDHIPGDDDGGKCH